MNEVLEELGKIGIIPVIKIDDVEKAVPLAKAVAAGGIPCAEVAFRTVQGEEAIRRISKAVPNILLGAGAVLTIDQADSAINAGAKFIVNTGFNSKVAAYCVSKGIPVIPGCSNPSDIEQALEMGLDVVKFFPAEQAGGLDYIKAIAASYPNLKFIPAGGINAGNISKYIAFEKIHACSGSWMVNTELVNEGDFDKIAILSREALLNMFDFRVAHIGINANDESAALNAANCFNTLFGFAVRKGVTSFFASDNIEITKTPKSPGTHGHIAVGTSSIHRAVAYLERNGIAFDHATAKKDANGSLAAVYCKEEIIGFAVHLLQRK